MYPLPEKNLHLRTFATHVVGFLPAEPGCRRSWTAESCRSCQPQRNEVRGSRRMGKSRSCAAYPSVGLGLVFGWFGPFWRIGWVEHFPGKTQQKSHPNFWVGPKRKLIFKPSMFRCYVSFGWVFGGSVTLRGVI